MIGRFTKTVVEDWKGRDCSRLDFRGTDTRSPFFGDPSLWDDDGEPVDIDEVLEYIKGRRTLEGVILGGEPLRDPDIYSILKKLRTTKVPIRIETCGDRPLEIDDFAGARMVNCVLLRLMASPFSDSFSKAMPGIKAGNVADTLDLLQGLEVMTEIELIAVPGIVTANDVKAVARTLGKKTVLTIRQFNPDAAPDVEAKKLKPYSRSEAAALSAAAKPFTNKAVLRGF